MRTVLLVGACGLSIAATAGGEAILQKHDASAQISDAEMSAFMKSRSEGVDRYVVKRSLADSAARGPVYAFQDTFDGPYGRITGFGPLTGSTLPGQIGLDGLAWGGISWGGIVDNAVAQTNMDGDPLNGEYNGPVGGPDPMGVRGGMLHVQRASINDASTGSGSGQFTYQYPHTLYTGTSAQPMFMEIDCYKPTHEDFQWIRPVSFTEGVLTSNIQMGGWNGTGLFATFAQRYGDPELLEGVTILASIVEIEGEFVTGPKMIPEHGWYTLGLFVDPANGMAVFVRDSETLTDADMDGSPDWKMPQNLVTGMRMFEEYGYGLEEGWASVLPGTLDDPMTTDIEGPGYARNQVNQITDRFLFNGNEFAPIFAGISLDTLQLIHGNDPSAAEFPGYVIKDWWWDDYRIRGVGFGRPDPIPAYEIPYVDDFERWFIGPMALQSIRWFESPDARLQVVPNANHTPLPGTGEGVPRQSLVLQNRVQNDIFQNMMRTNLPTTPRVRGLVGDPAVAQVSLRLETSLVSYGIDALEEGLAVRTAPENQPDGEDVDESMARVWTSCIDASGLGDGQVYVRQRKPLGSNVAGGEFDPAQPLVPTAGPHLTPDQEATINTEYINVIAAPAGMGGLTLPVDQWHTFSIEGEPGDGSVAPNGEQNIVRVYVKINDGPRTELFPNGDNTKQFTTNAIAPTDLRFASSNSFLAGFVRLYVDDVHFDGPTETDTIVPLASEFADDSPWTLPFADSFDTYEKGCPATPQGFANHRLGFMPIGDPHILPSAPNDWDEIEFIAGAPVLSDGDDVRVYEMVDGGAGFTPGELVAVSDNVLREYDMDFDIYGEPNPGGDPTEWYILDSVGGSETDRGTWRVTPGGGLDIFDSMTMTDMGARYSYRQDFRFTGTARENEFVSAADEGVDLARGGSRGDVVKLTNKGNIRDFSDPNGGQRNTTIDMFSAFLPLAQTEVEADFAVLSFDFYIGQSTFTTGMWAEINGGTADGGAITALSFGGLGLRSGNFDPMAGVFPTLPTGTFGYLIKNPSAAPGEPDNIWVDTGTSVPTEQWFTVEVEINGASEYTLRVNGLEVASGLAIDAGDAQLNTTSLDNISFVRNQWGENDGEPTEGVVQISARGPMEPAPLAGGVGPYHFFWTEDIDDANTTSLPLIVAVNSFTGFPLEDSMMMPLPPRELRETDVIAVINQDPATMGPVPHPLLNDRWEVVEDDGMGGFNVVANGEWIPQGLPGVDGTGGNRAPTGGIVMGATPAYNADPPYYDILLADYVTVPGNTVLPSDVWYVDALSLMGFGGQTCPADLGGGSGGARDGQVNSADLAILLAAWGINPGHRADIIGGPGFTPDGQVNSADLAVLLAAWGPCPN